MGNVTALVCELQPGDQLESVSLRAMANGKLRAFAPASFSQVNNTKFIRYDISGRIAAFKLLGSPVSKQVLLGMISGIADAMASIEENNVDISTVVLDPNHVFTDAASGGTVLICRPLIVKPTGANAGALCQFLLNKAQMADPADSGVKEQLLEFLKRNPAPNPGELKAAVEHAAQAAPAQPKADVPVQVPAQPPVPAQPVVVSQPQPQIPEDKPLSMFRLLEHQKKMNAPAPQIPVQPAAPAKPAAAPKPAFEVPPAPAKAAPKPAFEVPPVSAKNAAPKPAFEVPPAPVKPAEAAHRPVEVPPAPKPVQPVTPPKPVQPVTPPKPVQPVTPPMPVQPVTPPQPKAADPSPTTVVDANAFAGAHAYLLRLKTGDRAPITKPFFRIGKEKSFVDYCISDNSAISRAHAYILNKNGQYFLVDTHSTNHTYINGGMIQPDVETRLFHGAKLRLANEEFEFRLH